MAQKCRILIADDGADARELLAQLLEGDFEVTTVQDGAEAIASIERARPDLLILDWLMPVADGFAVLAYLAEHPLPFLPVIVRSAVAERDARLKALKMGAHEVLGRPFDEEELTIRIRSMLTLKEARDAAEQRADLLEVSVEERTRSLALAVEELRKTNRYKDEFLSVISHELRTPLGFIIGCASSLEDGVAGDLTPEQRSLVDIISTGGVRMLELVSNLLDMSLLAAGRFQVDTHCEDYDRLVEQAVEGLRPLAAERGVALAAQVDVPDPVVLDGRRTVQLLTNLVQNAIKFTQRGGAVTIKAYMHEGDLVTEVADNGVGISSEDVPRLFKQFKQLDMSSTREVGGSGLGLSLSKAIVDAHGGQIGVMSTPGVGSTFWFTLPENPAAVSIEKAFTASQAGPAAG